MDFEARIYKTVYYKGKKLKQYKYGTLIITSPRLNEFLGKRVMVRVRRV